MANYLDVWQTQKVYEGIHDGQIIPFDDEFYATFSDKYAVCLPIWMSIKYCERSVWELGNCMMRSLYMFLSLEKENVVLCRGDWLKDDHHGWIEQGERVYCPTYLHSFPKELFYEVFKIKNVEKHDYGEFVKRYPDKQYRSTWYKLEDYMPGGIVRPYLTLLLPFYELQATEPGREDFLKDLMAWEQRIGYKREVIFQAVEDRIPDKEWQKQLRTTHTA